MCQGLLPGRLEAVRHLFTEISPGQPGGKEIILASGIILGLGIGNHEKEFTKCLFALPISMKERLAWIHLQRRVQAGELPA
jgi:hypothetical protein